MAPDTGFSERICPDALVSVVLPVFNEVAVLRELHRRLTETLTRRGCRYEILYVNDGSSDGSREILDSLADEDTRVRVLHFSRNFGHQAAVQAGLVHAGGDAVVVMDSDMQDDPDAIGDFLDQWQQGYDVVYAVRTKRKEWWGKRLLFAGFYRLLNSISQTEIPTDAGNFGLVDRQVVRQIAALGDYERYYPGLRRWVGFRQTGVPVERLARHDGRPRVSLFGLFRLAQAAIFSFSTVPLKAFYGLAGLSLLAAIVVSTFVLYHRLFTGLAIPGWTSILIVASFFGALNALGIGILGEYVIRIYDQVRGRPLFLVAEKRNFAEVFANGVEDRSTTAASVR